MLEGMGRLMNIVEKLNTRLNNLELEIHNIQEQCCHPKLTERDVAYNTPYDPTYWKYWKVFNCDLCKKNWSEYQ